jgi:hydrogenase nickel incorporation protein HypA/HybF
MHELAVCQSLLRQVDEVARDHGSTVVTRVLVTIGPLSGIEAPLLDRAFAIARMNTVAQTAKLEIEKSAVIVWCSACAKASTVPPNRLLCSQCRTWKVSLKSGNELFLKRVDLSDAEAPLRRQREVGDVRNDVTLGARDVR